MLKPFGVDVDALLQVGGVGFGDYDEFDVHWGWRGFGVFRIF